MQLWSWGRQPCRKLNRPVNSQIRMLKGTVYFFYFSMWVILSFTSISSLSRSFWIIDIHFRPRDSLYKHLVLPLTCSFGFLTKSSCSNMSGCSCISRNSCCFQASYVVRWMKDQEKKISTWRVLRLDFYAGIEWHTAYWFDGTYITGVTNVVEISVVNSRCCCLMLSVYLYKMIIIHAKSNFQAV